MKRVTKIAAIVLLSLLVIFAFTVAVSSCAYRGIALSDQMNDTVTHKTRASHLTPAQQNVVQPLLDEEDKALAAYYDSIRQPDKTALSTAASRLERATAATEKKLKEYGQ